MLKTKRPKNRVWLWTEIENLKQRKERKRKGTPSNMLIIKVALKVQKEQSFLNMTQYVSIQNK